MLAFPIVFGGMINLCIARGDLIEGIECLYPFTRGKIVHFHATIGHIGQSLGKTLCTSTETGEISTPRSNHSNFHRLFCMDGRGSGNHGSGGNGTNTSFFNKFSSFHSIPP